MQRITERQTSMIDDESLAEWERELMEAQQRRLEQRSHKHVMSYLIDSLTLDDAVAVIRKRCRRGVSVFIITKTLERIACKLREHVPPEDEI